MLFLNKIFRVFLGSVRVPDAYTRRIHVSTENITIFKIFKYIKFKIYFILICFIV